MGGKAKIAGKITDYLKSVRKPGQLYIEPFVGAANIVAKMDGERHAFDAHPDLILLWQALKSGWRPPSNVSRELHRELRYSTPSALRAFVGFGCCFAGCFFTGYVKNSAATALRSIDRKLATLAGVTFARAEFQEHRPKGALIYCDPPYLGTCGFSTGRFDHELFWETCRAWSRHNTVIISEASAPGDFEAVLAIKAPCGLRRADGTAPARQEFLFRYRG